ncbi:MAG TPA: cation transporter dimerization domain-containing protein [Bryobacteraceae bacterium]|nr:cation transporter dimerization domain-containing protein [Bryobacteraceae bacterium]
MSRRSGRAFVFVRWTAAPYTPARLGDVAWAFEQVDRLGRFYCYYCGGSEWRHDPIPARARTAWHEKCLTLPELIKAMSGQGPERPGYDEVKVLEVEEAEPDAALKFAQRPDDPARPSDPLEEVREIISRYGAHGFAAPKGFSAPFLWYNMLPGRSVPLRKLPVHLFQLRAASERRNELSADEVEDQARKVAEAIPGVLGVSDCFIARLRSDFLITVDLVVSARLSVGDGRILGEAVEEALRAANPAARYVFARVRSDET